MPDFNILHYLKETGIPVAITEKCTIIPIECVISNSSLLDFFYTDIVKIQDEVYTNTLIELHEDSWLLYSPEQARHETSLIPPTLPLTTIRPIVDSLTLNYIKDSLVIPCFELLKTTVKIETGIVEKNKEIVITGVQVNYSEEELSMVLDPLGHGAIIDIDEIHHRNRRSTDDPYIKATAKKLAHRFPKIDDAERR